MENIRTRDLRRIFQNKYVVFLGDSNMRSIYKDFISLLQEEKLISDSDRKAGGNKESICGKFCVFRNDFYYLQNVQVIFYWKVEFIKVYQVELNTKKNVYFWQIYFSLNSFF